MPYPYKTSPITITALATPPCIPDLTDGQPAIDVAVQHLLDELDVGGRHDPRDAELVVEDLVDAVKGVLLVDERVEEDAEGPDVLLLAAVRLALQDLGGRVVWTDAGWWLIGYFMWDLCGMWDER